jgi:tRNA A58 N-methylase Trm61
MSLELAYFDAMYARGEDPWHFRTRWYERRKRALVIASLPKPRYTRVFEPGASNGELSAELATRCDQLVVFEPQSRAVLAAHRRLQRFANVDIRAKAIPDDWPEGHFDLVVLSEVAYYLDAISVDRLVGRCANVLDSGGTLVLCHWRPAVEQYPQSGDAVHARFAKDLPFAHLVEHAEADFLLDVWSADSRSVAQCEGLG